VRRSPFFSFCLTATVLLAIHGTAAAQEFGDWPKPAPAPKPEGEVTQVKIKGQIKGARGDLVYVVNEEGAQWVVKMPAEPRQIRLVGAAVPAWLQPGMLVRFSGQFDQNGKPQAPIKRIEVFTYRPPREGQTPEKPGVFLESAVSGIGLFQDPNAAAASKIQSFIIIGQLRGLKKGEMMVAAGAVPVRVELAEDAEIAVDIADYRWARIDDEIELSGWHYPLIKTQVYATNVTIRSANPIGKVDEAAVPPAMPPQPGMVPPKPGAVPPKKAPAEDLPF
jgi:hypothetical protein